MNSHVLILTSLSTLRKVLHYHNHYDCMHDLKLNCAKINAVKLTALTNTLFVMYKVQYKYCRILIQVLYEHTLHFPFILVIGGHNDT